jgi:hypothetical protein
MRRIVKEMVSEWGCSDVYIGCSGNFTVERVLLELGRYRLHGNDVTIYSGAIGSYLAEQPFKIRLKEEYHERLPWIVPYMKYQVDAAATVMLMSRVVDAFTAGGEFKQNGYYERILGAFENQFDDLHDKTRQKLESLAGEMTSYYSGDVVPWAAEIPKDAGFVSYPPFFSGDYEAMFAKLDLLFDWDKPSYEEIGDGNLDGFIEAVTDRPYWCFGSNRRWPDLEKHLRGVTQTTNRGVPIHVYASGGPMRVVTPEQPLALLSVPRMSGEVGERLSIAQLEYDQFCALRSQYMNEDIRPGQTGYTYAVLCDDQLVGVFAFTVAPTMSALQDVSRIYMLSDFPIRPTRYKHLAKLVLVAGLSKEAKILAERAANRRIKEALTTAFSERPVSMKYRGLFDLLSRKERGDNDDWAGQYQLNYLAKMGDWSLEEGLDLWKRRYSKTV